MASAGFAGDLERNNKLANNHESDRSVSPFNQYNIEVVRFDATNSTMMSNGDLVRRELADKNEQDGDDDDDDNQLGMFRPNYELVKHLIPTDSINNKSFTDVTFIVGPPQHSKKYVGHRVLLAMTSPVFETLFYGDMADKSKYIRIVDVAPIGFENLLRYAYTDSLNLNSVEDAMLTAYAAKKYLLPQLLRECLTYIEHNIGPSTACVVFEFAHVLNSQQLVLQAMNLIDRQTMNVISNKSFNHVQASTVEFVANRKYLNLSTEYALFNAVVNWTLAETRRRNLDPNEWTSVRSIMRESSILEAVRFLAMTQEEFARAVARTSSTVASVAAGAAATGRPSTTDGGGHQNNNGDNSAEANQSDAEQSAGSGGKATGKPQLIDKVNTDDPNSLLSDTEQRAIFLNLALGDVAKLPPTINPSTEIRQAPPEYFTLKRFKSGGSSGASNLIVTTTTTRGIKSICSKFQSLSENVFIVGLTIPIRLDASSYSNRTPKFECHLKFTTRATSQSPPPAASGGEGQQQQQQESAAGSTLLMDTIDESLHISIAKDKDCLVRLKRPILIRMGNINELTLTFQTYALDEDIISLRTPKLRSANFSEQTDGENISWLFFKTPGLEFSELHYYY